MKTIKRICFIVMVISFAGISSLSAQVYSNKEVGKKNADKIDSLKNSEYPYVLPIWGAKATKKGFNLPYSAGLSVQYLWQKQDLIINNLSVGFNNGEMHNLDEVIRFDNAVSEAAGINFRPDVWVFPFLNVYGIFAKSKPSTTVGFGIWVPDSTNIWKEVFNTTTKAEFDAFSAGFGLTPTIGVGGGWIALDMNFTWTDVTALDKPVYSYIFDPRIGKTFNFKKKDQNIAIWVGGFRWSITSDTRGSVAISELGSSGELGTKVDQGNATVADAQQQVDNWWNGLSSTEQRNPVNVAKYETANRALGAAGNFLGVIDGAVNNFSSSTVQYHLAKRPAEMWNFIVGGQFQYSKHWMLRAEYGFLGTRNQFFTGLQYRFGL
jgi:hypothetical protein